MAAFAPSQAWAGAWIAPEEGQEIWTNVAGQRGGVSFFESSAYWEIPLREDVAAVAAPWVEQGYDVGEDGWRAEATLAAKKSLFRGERSAMALQGGAVWTSLPTDGCGEGGAELRGLYGRSLGEDGFLNLEVAARAFEGGCGGQRLDLTYGRHVGERWMALGQIFMDADRSGDEALKAQFTLVRFGEAGKAIQFGLRGRIDDGFAEPALVIGLWGRPGQ